MAISLKRKRKRDSLEDDSVSRQKYNDSETCYSNTGSVANLDILPALPPRTRSLSSRPTLALDLDETLVHCSLQPLDGASFSLNVPCNESNSVYVVHVRTRPYLELFLDHVSKKFEVVIFTASKRAYAERLLHQLDPKRALVRHRLYREHCTKLPTGPDDGGGLMAAGQFPQVYAKDLRVLGRDLSRTVLVDNCIQATSIQVSTL